MNTQQTAINAVIATIFLFFASVTPIYAQGKPADKSEIVLTPAQTALIQRINATERTTTGVERARMIDELLAAPLPFGERALWLGVRAEANFQTALSAHNKWNTLYARDNAATKFEFRYTGDAERALQQAIADDTEAIKIDNARTPSQKFTDDQRNSIGQARVRIAQAAYERATFLTQAKFDYKDADAKAAALSLGGITPSLAVMLLTFRADCNASADNTIPALVDLANKRRVYKSDKNENDSDYSDSLWDRTGDLLLYEAYRLRLAKGGDNEVRYTENDSRLLSDLDDDTLPPMPKNPGVQTRIRYAAYLIFLEKLPGEGDKPKPADYAANEASLKAAIVQDKTRVMPHRLLAQQYVQADRTADALASANAALAIDPKNVPSLCIRAIAYAKAKDWAKAETDLTLAINTYPELAYLCNAYGVRAIVRTQLGMPDKAKSDAAAVAAWEKLRVAIRKR